MKEHLRETTFANDENGGAFNEAFLQQMSLLRQEGRVDRRISPALFSAIIEEKQKNQEASLEEILDYIMLRAEGAPSQEVAALLREGKTRRDDLHQDISGLRGEQINGRIQVAADRFSHDVAHLDAGGQILFMGKAGSKPTGVGGITRLPLIGQEFPDDMRTLLTSDDPRAIGDLIKNAVIREVLGYDAGNAPDVEAFIHESFDRMQARLNDQLPENWTAAIVQSLREDARELACGRRSEEGRQTDIEKLYDRIAADGLNQVVERAVGEVLLSIREIFSDRLDEYVELVTKHASGAGITLLTQQGIIPSSQNPFWVEITKNENGRFTVKLFANGAGAEDFPEVQVGGMAGVQIPLIFENIEEEKLSNDFFYRLYSYEYWPRSETNVTAYSIDDVVLGMTGYLGKARDAANVSEIFPHALAEKKGMVPLMHLYLFHHQERDIKRFYRDISFNTSLQSFVDYWKEKGIHENLIRDRALRNQFRKGIDQLTKEAIFLHTDEVITDDQLKSIYATIWEIEQKLGQADKQRLAENRGGVAVPPAMQETLKAILLKSGVDSAYIELVKEAFLAAAGDEAEEIFDAAINELLPELAPTKEFQGVEDMSWDKVFDLESVKKKIQDLQMNRLSVLQLVKFFVKFSVLLFSIYRLSLTAKTIAQTIDRYCPGIKGRLPCDTYYLGLALTILGPQFFAKTLPKDVFEPIVAIYRLANDVTSYLFYRMCANGFKEILKKTLSEDKKAEIREIANNLQQDLLRRGEFSYEVEHDDGIAGQVDLHFVFEQLNNPDIGVETSPIFWGGVPSPNPIEVTAENYQDAINGWINDIGAIDAVSPGETDYYPLIYLNEQIRNLPVPMQSESEMWEDMENPQEALEHVHLLLCKLYEVSAKGQQCPRHRTETVISFYTLYAIIDHLAKQCPEAYLNDYDHPANGEDLFHFTQTAGLKIGKERSLNQLREVCRYFDFELGDRLEAEEIQVKYGHALFNYRGTGTWLYAKAYGHDFREGGITVNPLRSLLSDTTYYDGLLDKPEILERLEAHGVPKNATRADKKFTLFKDPSIHDLPQEKRGVIKQGTHAMDRRKGVVPRPFYILSLVDKLARTRTVFEESFDHEHFRADPLGRGFELPEYTLPNFSNHDPIEKGINYVTDTFHKVTGNAFKARRMRAHSLAIIDRQEERLKRIEKRCIGRKTDYTAEHTVGASRRMQSTYKEEDFKEKRVDQSVIIDTTEIDQNSLLTPEEKRLLKMIQSYDSDRLIRTLSFFSHRKDRLRSPEFRVLFDLLAQNLVALEKQAIERADIAHEVGQFFHETIEHFRRTGDLETSLYMSKVGIELRGYFESIDPNYRLAFPNFSQEIRERIIPAYQALPEHLQMVNFGANNKISGIYLALATLAMSHQNDDPRKLTQQEKAFAAWDVTRFALYQGKVDHAFRTQDIMIQAQEVTYRWADEVRQAFDILQNRNYLITTLFKDSGIEFGDDWNWDGHFPAFDYDGIQIDLSTRTINGQIAVFLKDQGEQILRERFNVEELGPAILHPNGSYEYPQLNLSIKWNNVFQNFQIFRVIDGEEGEYYDPNALTFNWNQSPYQFREKDVTFVTGSKVYVYRDQEIVARFTKDPFGSITLREEKIDGEWYRSVNLRDKKHGLRLLKWVTNLRNVEAFCPVPVAGAAPLERDPITYFRLNKLGLSFKIEEDEEGNLQAFSQNEGTKGYYLKRRQDDPRLKNYPQTLHLINDSGGERAILETSPIQTHLAEFLVQNVAKVKGSPLIDKVIDALCKEGGELLGQVEKTYPFRFDDQGKLVSTDPEAVAYLALYHLSHGDIDEIKHYVKELEALGRREPFSRDAKRIIDQMMLYTTITEGSIATELTLRLAGIREENVLVQTPIKGDPAEVTYHSREILRSFAIQYHYLKYLERLQFGGREYLGPETELFILKHLSRVTEGAVRDATTYFDEDQKGVIASYGPGFLSERLMAPNLVRRLHYLRMKLGEDNVVRAAANNFMSEAFWYDRTNPYTQFLTEPKRQGALSQINTLAKEVIKSPLAKPANVNYVEALREPNFSLEDVPIELSIVKPEMLRKEFLSYYRLAKGEIPPEWIGNEQMEALFDRKSKKFRENLHMMRGNIPTEYLLFFDLLYRVSKGSSFASFISADEIRVEMIAITQGVIGLKERYTELGRVVDSLNHRHLNPYREEMECVLKKLQNQPPAGVYPVEDFNKLIHDLVQKARLAGGVELLSSVATVDNAKGALKKGALFGVQFIGAVPYLAARTILYPNYVGVEQRIARGLFRTARQVYDAYAQRQGALLDPSQLSEELAQTLTQREGNMDRAMEELLEDYYIVERVEEPPLPPMPQGLFNAEHNDETLRAGLEEFNRTLDDYQNRARGNTLRLTLKEGRSAEEFYEVLSGFRREFKTMLEKEQRTIMNYVTKDHLTAEDETARTLNRLEKSKVKDQALTFDDVMKWFLDEDDSIMLSRCEMKQEDLPELKEMVFRYLVAASRFDLLFAELDKTAPDGNLIPVAEEMLRKRVYQFEAGTHERLLKAKLAYEVQTGRRIWKIPTDQLDEMILSGNKGLVNVIIMGQGKSSFVAPAASKVAADGQHIAINVWPKAVKKASVDLMAHYGKDVLGQEINAFSIGRQRNWTSDQLWGLVKVFERSIENKEQINVTQEDLQALQLLFILVGADLEGEYARNPEEHDKQITQLRKILKLIREKGKGNVDEVHEATREDKQLNFPIRKKRTLKKEHAECLEEVLLQLMTTPEVAHLLNIKTPEAKILKKEVFERDIAPIIARKLAASKRLKISPEDRDLIAAYLCGQSEEVPRCAVSHPRYSEICLMRGALLTLLPHSLENIMHKHYHTASREAGVEYVKPSEGNVNTVDEADLLSPFETFIKTCLLILHDRLSDEQVKAMIPYMKSRAEGEAESMGIHKDHTPTAQTFNQHLCPGLVLSLTTADNLTEDHVQRLRDSDAVNLAYVRHFIRQQIQYFPTILESNGQDFAMMFESFFSYTGTPDMDLTPVGTDMIARPGILGESLHTFETKTREVRVFDRNDPREILEHDIIENFFRADPNNVAIVDRGAALNGMATLEVAQRLWRYIQDERPDLKGVAFYIKDQAMIIDRSGIKPLSESKIKPEERLTYYDEPHSYAADIRQKRRGRALLTVGETTKFEGEIDQAEWRMRGLLTLDQEIVVGMTRHVKTLMVPEERDPTVRDVTTFACKNGKESKKMRNFRVDCQKLHSTVKRAVLDAALNATSALDGVFTNSNYKTTQILRDYEEILFSNISDDPILLYGALRIDSNPKELLRLMKEKLLAKVYSHKHFTDEQIAQLEYKLTRIVEGESLVLAEEMVKKVKDAILNKAQGEEIHQAEVIAAYQEILTHRGYTILTPLFNGWANPLDATRVHLINNLHAHGHFTAEEIDAITQELTAIQERLKPRLYPATIKTFDRSLEALETIGKSVQVVASANHEEEAQEQEEEQNEMENNALIGRGENNALFPPPSDIKWSNSIDPTNIKQWFNPVDPRSHQFSMWSDWKIYTPPLFRLSEGLEQSELEAVRNMGKTLPQNVYCSWNLFKVISSKGSIIEPFGPRQKPIFEFLLIQEENDQKILLIDQAEGDFWRKKLEEDREGNFTERDNVKIALVDNITGAIGATGRNEITPEDVNKAAVRRARTLLKFFSGYTNYSDQEMTFLEPWIRKHGVDPMMNFFEPIAYGPHEKEPYESSVLQSLIHRIQNVEVQPDLIRV
ncbi:MAG: DUF3638 domain-containing protein [Chlamydiia bacterium]|nr:DUF3638 domain-containing protein [Chlamydiia bacterium]